MRIATKIVLKMLLDIRGMNVKNNIKNWKTTILGLGAGSFMLFEGDFSTKKIILSILVALIGIVVGDGDKNGR